MEEVCLTFIIPVCNFYACNAGHVSLSSGMNFTLNSDNEFTLTCVSTGGPATTVTWTRNRYYATVHGRAETVLDDPVTAQYTHFLMVTGKLVGLYTCTVANEISSESMQLRIHG